ncbi:MAG: SPOR domain-containing protein [Bacteroidales bacterium]|nr:SPOR domain-containing protein [Bacteroidales bacterium]MBQ1884926.1 SPOR domain-containing protein [Bacteroidales bacterium]MBQ3617874.1 SPOR domain-containing protein [Bacteroidales bacterium]MDD6001201.1 SPOR domain-containing protein [Bacteroidales bacterium]
MSKIKLFGLTLLTLAVLMVSCKGNKGNESSDNSDTLAYPFGTDDSELTFGDQAPYIDTTTIAEPIMLEDQQGNLQPETTPVVNESDMFYIIAGSFTVYSNAQNLCNKLKVKGFNAEILIPFGQYNRVSVKSFKTREEAKAAIASLKSKLGDDGLWILKR